MNRKEFDVVVLILTSFKETFPVLSSSSFRFNKMVISCVLSTRLIIVGATIKLVKRSRKKVATLIFKLTYVFKKAKIRKYTLIIVNLQLKSGYNF
ncbi:hypothetical protein LPB136_12315 [Tenacibaculum todarodis]|uniref:Uncharacterized protein n=1 Tax=Tenacibaculum todarodis TaxID=1850252 RepID=A0A1L3JLU7_9FLAO|nr:hypothetical protein LPB136_12315 [Tenacibaculum todarodis]